MFLNINNCYIVYQRIHCMCMCLCCVMHLHVLAHILCKAIHAVIRYVRMYYNNTLQWDLPQRSPSLYLDLRFNINVVCSDIIHAFWHCLVNQNAACGPGLLSASGPLTLSWAKLIILLYTCSAK